MKFKVNDSNPGTWFNFIDGKPEEGGVCVRAMTPSKLAEIEKKYSERKSEYIAPKNQDGKQLPAQRFVWLEYNEDEMFADRWDYCICDWRNLCNEDGVEIPCTKENKVKLMGEELMFSAFILSCLQKLNLATQEEMKERAKNLFGTSKATSGSSTAEIAEKSTL